MEEAVLDSQRLQDAVHQALSSIVAQARELDAKKESCYLELETARREAEAWRRRYLDEKDRNARLRRLLSATSGASGRHLDREHLSLARQTSVTPSCRPDAVTIRRAHTAELGSVSLAAALVGAQAADAAAAAIACNSLSRTSAPPPDSGRQPDASSSASSSLISGPEREASLSALLQAGVAPVAAQPPPPLPPLHRDGRSPFDGGHDAPSSVHDDNDDGEEHEEEDSDDVDHSDELPLERSRRMDSQLSVNSLLSMFMAFTMMHQGTTPRMSLDEAREGGGGRGSGAAHSSSFIEAEAAGGANGTASCQSAAAAAAAGKELQRSVAAGSQSDVREEEQGERDNAGDIGNCASVSVDDDDGTSGVGLVAAAALNTAVARAWAAAASREQQQYKQLQQEASEVGYCCGVSRTGDSAAGDGPGGAPPSAAAPGASPSAAASSSGIGGGSRVALPASKAGFRLVASVHEDLGRVAALRGMSHASSRVSLPVVHGSGSAAASTPAALSSVDRCDVLTSGSSGDSSGGGGGGRGGAAAPLAMASAASDSLHAAETAADAASAAAGAAARTAAAAATPSAARGAVVGDLVPDESLPRAVSKTLEAADAALHSQGGGLAPPPSVSCKTANLQLRWLSPPRTALVVCKHTPAVRGAFEAALHWLSARGVDAYVEPGMFRQLAAERCPLVATDKDDAEAAADAEMALRGGSRGSSGSDLAALDGTSPNGRRRRNRGSGGSNGGGGSSGMGLVRTWPAECANIPPSLAKRLDFGVVLGGDGTVLWTCYLAGNQAVPPLVPFNLGSLGFLAPFHPDALEHVLASVLRGGFPLMLRHRLQCSVLRRAADGSLLAPAAAAGGGGGDSSCSGGSTPRGGSGSGGGDFTALNEVVIDRGISPFLTNLDVFCDGVFLTHVQGDGLIVSTPTGSTAYNLAAGGSMVHPQVPCVLFTPICPHSLSFRPLIFPDHVQICVQVPMDARAQMYCSFDGKDRQELRPGDALVVRLSRWPVPSVCSSDHTRDWFRSVRETLHWNVRKQQAGAGQ